MNALKRFLGNKNTVTILGVILGVVVLYIGYNWRVGEELKLETIPCAKQNIEAATLITKDMLTTVKVSKDILKSSPNLIKNSNQLINKYVTPGTSIVKNGLFYTDQIVAKEDLPNSSFENIPDGYTIFSLKVDLQSTYGNSIYPGDYIDLYFKAVDSTNKIIFGEFIKSIEVLDVKDSQGRHVFTLSETRTPSSLLFAVPTEYYLLLMKAGYITSSQVSIIPVPRNKTYTETPGATEISSEDIKAFIESKSTPVDTNDLSNNTEVTPNTDTPTQ